MATAGAVLPVTITAAPRHGKPWQAMIGARLASACMILLIGLSDGAAATALSNQIPTEQRATLKARLAAEAMAELPGWVWCDFAPKRGGFAQFCQ
jgi:hypothetical protein